MVVELAWHSGS